MGDATQAQFAAEAGISQAGLHKLLNGGEPNLGTLIALAKAAGVSVEWLATGGEPSAALDEERLDEDEALREFALVPRYEDVAASAGPGAIATSEVVTERFAFRSEWLREIGVPPSHAVLVGAAGDSMEPLIPDGALILVDTSARDVRNGCIYVIVMDGDLLVKRVHRKIDGSVWLTSENPRYHAEMVPPDVLEKLHIVGRVRWVARTI